MNISDLQHDHHAPQSQPGAGLEPRTLVLLGAGRTHIQLLAQLARQPLRGVQVVLVEPHARHLCPDLLPAWLAGHATESECSVPIEPLVHAAGVRWVAARVVGLDANTHTVVLDTGERLGFDWASINTGLVQERAALEQQLPGAGTHALCVRPTESFIAAWPHALALAQERALRIAVIGSDRNAVQTALALRQRLGHCALTLVAPEGLCPQLAAAVRTRLAQALRRHQVTVLHDHATALHEGHVALGCGARLACDLPVVTLGAQAPAWLGNSGLAHHPGAGVAVNAHQQSSSHLQILVLGSLGQARSTPGDARRAGAALARQLQALSQGLALPAPQASRRGLELLYTGADQAMAHWGPWCTQGRWVLWCKQWHERRQLARCARA